MRNCELLEMNMPICQDDFCWLCSTPGSCCDCGLSESFWSTPPSQESYYTFEGHEEPGCLDMDEPAFCTIDGDYFLAGAFDDPDFELGVLLRRSRDGSQHPDAASTPKNNDEAEHWESPGAMPPPESSSPAGFDADSSSSTWRLQCREGPDVDRWCGLLDGGQCGGKASSNHSADLNTPTSPATTSMSHSSLLPTNFSMPFQGSLDGRPCAIGRRHIVADAHDAWKATSAVTFIEGSLEQHEVDTSTPRNHVPAPRKRAIFSGPPVLDLTKANELELALPQDTENDERCDAVTTNHDTSLEGIRSEMSCDRVSLVSVSCSSQAITDNLKRRRSSVNSFEESKRAKLDRTLSHVSCASNASAQSKYKATEPASLRRAQSLRSEISTCSVWSMTSLFGPSPLSPLTSRPFPDEAYPPTVPCTPIPNSADYARSKANPLVRTLAVYHCRSRDIPKIPPVPIIAPPPCVLSTVVRCPEDHAIDRIEALLRREHSERERDGLNTHDEKRTERLIAIYGPDPAYSRRDDASTVDSSDDGELWEEESATESQESQRLSRTAKIQILSEQHRLANRDTWTNAYGIANDFRKEITRWILEKLPKEPGLLPANAPRHERPRGIDLYDQLVHSFQTRFHAAQLFHRYFLLPEKIEYWREMCGCADFISGSWKLSDHYERGIWDIAVACMALAVKLHRDCLSPLRPVFAAEFLEMAPYLMTHDTFELAQRDVLYSFQFQLGCCTPQDVLDELWSALPTLRKAAAPIGWAAVQCATWDKLFESLLEPDILQYPATLLTAAALVDSLTLTLACQYKTEEKATSCKCQALSRAAQVSEWVLDDTEPTSWQIHLFEANQLVDDVILDVRDVLHLSAMELDECRKWLSHVGRV